MLLVLLAVSLVLLGKLGVLNGWAEDAHRELLLAADANFMSRLLDRMLVYLGHFSHLTTLGLVLLLYAGLEGAEGVGLALHKRWAEYLTVFGTGLLIPYEVYEVLRHATLFKGAALVLNLAVVAYLAYRKRLFVDV